MKTRTHDTMKNHEDIQEYIEMLRSHRDKKFKDDLAKMKEELEWTTVKENVKPEV